MYYKDFDDIFNDEAIHKMNQQTPEFEFELGPISIVQDPCGSCYIQRDKQRGIRHGIQSQLNYPNEGFKEICENPFWWFQPHNEKLIIFYKNTGGPKTIGEKLALQMIFPDQVFPEDNLLNKR